VDSATTYATREFSLVTHYLGDQLDLKKLRGTLAKHRYLNRDHPLVIEVAPEQFAVLTKFGTVTFWNVPEERAAEFMREAAPFVRGYLPALPTGKAGSGQTSNAGHVTDTLTIRLGAAAEVVTFDEVSLRSLDLEKIKIISYVSAQSVALNRYEEEIDERLRELGSVVENLKTAGHTKFTERGLLKQVGQVLSVKQNAVSSLSLFDKPEETWEREEIEQLYVKLRSEYELRDRFDILNEKIDFLSENNTALINFIAAQKANLLELIIVILIVFEIILFMLDIFHVFR
jgi:uncharacterized Rmd1/YagE family protein